MRVRFKSPRRPTYIGGLVDRAQAVVGYINAERADNSSSVEESIGLIIFVSLDVSGAKGEHQQGSLKPRFADGQAECNPTRQHREQFPEVRPRNPIRHDRIR